MTHPMAVEELQHDEAVVERYGDEIALPLFVAIQLTFEEAMASIDDIARSSPSAAPGGAEPHPRTEKIDLRLVKPPAVPEAPLPPTTAMSLAARCLAEHPVGRAACPPAAADEARSRRRTASAPTEPGARAEDRCSDLLRAARRRLRSWWP